MTQSLLVPRYFLLPFLSGIHSLAFNSGLHSELLAIVPLSYSAFLCSLPHLLRQGRRYVSWKQVSNTSFSSKSSKNNMGCYLKFLFSVLFLLGLQKVSFCVCVCGGVFWFGVFLVFLSLLLFWFLVFGFFIVDISLVCNSCSSIEKSLGGSKNHMVKIEQFPNLPQNLIFHRLNNVLFIKGLRRTVKIFWRNAGELSSVMWFPIDTGHSSWNIYISYLNQWSKKQVLSLPKLMKSLHGQVIEENEKFC